MRRRPAQALAGLACMAALAAVLAGCGGGAGKRATTQPGYQGTPLVQLTGLLAGDDADGLTIQAGPTTVKGLVIDAFRDGLVLEAGGNTIAGNWIGSRIPPHASSLFSSVEKCECRPGTPATIDCTSASSTLLTHNESSPALRNRPPA